ncbi:MAG: recombinase family protein [Bdellovibrionota bacterium]
MEKRVAIYARVSTHDKQDPEMQLRELREYCRARGFTIFQEFIDRNSGAKERRIGLDALMEAARKRRFDMVLVWRFDRFARSTKHLIQALDEFKRLQIDFISFQENLDTSTPIGECMFTIISAIGQLERSLIRERIMGGLRNARAKGRQIGRPKQRNDILIRNLRSQGYSFRKISSLTNSSLGAIQRSLISQRIIVPNGMP